MHKVSDLYVAVSANTELLASVQCSPRQSGLVASVGMSGNTNTAEHLELADLQHLFASTLKCLGGGGGIPLP